MNTKTFWNEIGSLKDFEDPLYLEKLRPFIHSNSKIVEYGCGYGRLLNLLDLEGFKNLLGFDFAPNMIARGKNSYPHLELLHAESGKVPIENSSSDVVILSTILCCMVEKKQQTELIEEVLRILKPKGVLYLSDFLLSDHPRYADKYLEGIYTTSEGITVRHHSTRWIMQLLEKFNIQWFEQFDFKTMNNNFARTFHCIAQSSKKI